MCYNAGINTITDYAIMSLENVSKTDGFFLNKKGEFQWGEFIAWLFLLTGFAIWLFWEISDL